MFVDVTTMLSLSSIISHLSLQSISYIFLDCHSVCLFVCLVSIPFEGEGSKWIDDYSVEAIFDRLLPL